MIQDPGPKSNLGFGIPVVRGESNQEDVQMGVPTNAGGLAKALNDKPLLKFAAIATASLVSMHVAGKVVRAGGYRFAEFAQQYAAQETRALSKQVGEGLDGIRRLQKTLDEYEGLSRTLVDPTDNRIFVKRGPNGEWLRDEVTRIDSAAFRQSKEGAPDWLMRDEIQQRMINQARRLPYELPGFYLADKAVIDPLMEDGQQRKVNWANPFDVVGDFAWESVKNVAFNVIPFEAATGAGAQTLRRFRKAMASPAGPDGTSTGVLTAQVLVEQLGVKFQDIMDKTVRFSKQSTGAFSTAIEAASQHKRTVKDLARGIHHDLTAGPGAARMSGAAKRQYLINKNKELRHDALDSMPGPFSGMATGIKAFGKSFKEIGQTYDDWQNVISGRIQIKDIADDARRARLTSEMLRGGGGQIDAIAQQLQKMGFNTIANSDDVASNAIWNSSLAQVVKEDHYKDKLIQNLVSVAGLPIEDATNFVTKAAKIKFPSQKGKNVSHDLMERIRFGKKAHQTSGKQSWFDHLISDAEGQGIKSLRGVERNKFERAIRLSDSSFWSDVEQDIIKNEIKNYQSEIAKNIAPNFVGENIASRKVDFFSLKENLAYNENYLVRNTARTMGIKPYDGSGSPLSLSSLKNAIIDRGIDANDKERLLGYLLDQKVIKPPGSTGGWKKLFGFESISVQEAIDTGYFSAYPKEVQDQIKQLLDRRASSAFPIIDQSGKQVTESGLSALKMPGVYRGVNGNIIDVGKIKRGIVGAVDAFATETKIPILNFNPAQLLFYNSWMSARRSAPIQFASKYSAQIIKEQAEQMGRRTGINPLADQNGIYTFVRSGTRSKGKLFTSRVSQYGEAVALKQAPGEYKPFLTNRLSMTGKLAEVFLGRSSIPTSDKQKGWRKLFNVSTEQESNIFFGRESLLGRVTAAVRGKPQSKANPRRAARLFAQPGFKPESLDQYSAEALEDMLRQLKGYGLQGRVMQELRGSGIVSENSFFDDIIGSGRAARPDHLVPDYVSQLLRADMDSTLFSREQKAALATAQSSIRSLLRNADEQLDYWQLPVPRSIKTTGVSRRIHQLKSELSEYMVIRGGIIDEGKPFATKVASIIEEVEKLHLAGAISSAERAEARASALSLQLQFSRIQVLKDIETLPGGRLDFNRELIKKALDVPEELKPEIQSLFEDYGKYSTENQGLLGGVVGSIKSKFAPAAYSGPVESNPLGSAYTFIPTVSTGFRNNPWQTTKGLLGADWNNPEAITSGTIYSAHLVNRINKYFESIGLGLDVNQYKSPLDLYARGLIGKRILPAFAAGTSLLAVDRSLGGMVNKDEQGNPVYSPLVIGGLARGVVEGQALLAGGIPGGQTYSEKKEELLTGEVPIRQGRYWLLNSNTPFKGGRIQYFRPSWYQRLKAGGEYTPEMNQTPMERLAFGYDFSPLRPFDPYRFERQNYSSRPYPVTGDYFTGPFGPLTSLLNNTVGRIMKPSLPMHQAETTAALASYARVGDSGAISMGSVSQSLSGINASYAALAGTPGTSSVTPFYMANGYTNPRGAGSASTIATANSVVDMYSQLAAGGGNNRYPGVFAPMLSQGLGGVGVDTFGSQVVPATAAGRNSTFRNRVGRTGFEMQEMAGIYGFGTASIRSGLGIGNADFTPPQALLESASRGYSSSRSFWNLNLGGAGDLPLPIEGRFASLEFSEIIRRFVPKEQQGIQYINGIPNQLGLENPWLPGEGSMNNLKSGDPYNIPDATIRLPGTGRDRVQQRFGSTPGGQYSPIDIHDMLGDLDPFGDNYRQLDRVIESYATSEMDLAKIKQTRAQVEAVGIKNEFTPYKYKYLDSAEMLGEATMHPVRFSANKLFEDLAHRDTFINSKFLRTRTALEDWERDNVYGATYPSWNTPYQSFIEPIINKSTQRSPFAAASAAGAIGYMFGASPRAKAMGSILGGLIGGGAAMYGAATEAITGDRFIPKQRKQELMLEEQVDILSYMHSMVNASRALESGDSAAAEQFLQASSRTMYGANLNATPEQLALSVPKRKREHFKAMMYAPEQERDQILSTAGRLERRLLQAAWGRKVEKLPDLQNYFEDRELPSPDSSFWSPYTDMDSIKIKMGQNMGLDMSQMGYYPQQIQEANLINPAYPAIFSQTSSRNTRARLDQLLRNMGVRASIEQRPTPFSSGDRFELSMGSY